MWGLCKELSTVEILADLCLERFVRGKVYREGDHIRKRALLVEDASLDDDREDDDSVDVDCVRAKVGTLGRSAGKKRLRVATWNFSGLCKHKEVASEK